MEVRAIGTTDDKNTDNLLRLLSSLSGCKPHPIDIHTVVMKLAGPGKKQIHLQNYILPNSNNKNSKWLVYQYTPPLLGDLKLANLPATLRTVSQAKCQGPDVPGFWASLGFIQEYQHYKKGWTCDLCDANQKTLHVMVYKLHKVLSGDDSRAYTQSRDSELFGNGHAKPGDEVVPSLIVIEAWMNVPATTSVDESRTDDAFQDLVSLGKILEKYDVVLQPLPVASRRF